MPDSEVYPLQAQHPFAVRHPFRERGLVCEK
jgi:hypothetical protein